MTRADQISLEQHWNSEVTSVEITYLDMGRGCYRLSQGCFNREQTGTAHKSTFACPVSHVSKRPHAALPHRRANLVEPRGTIKFPASDNGCSVAFLRPIGIRLPTPLARPPKAFLTKSTLSHPASRSGRGIAGRGRAGSDLGRRDGGWPVMPPSGPAGRRPCCGRADRPGDS